jgi:hypothetical protein
MRKICEKDGLRKGKKGTKNLCKPDQLLEARWSVGEAEAGVARTQ